MFESLLGFSTTVSISNSLAQSPADPWFKAVGHLTGFCTGMFSFNFLSLLNLVWFLVIASFLFVAIVELRKNKAVVVRIQSWIAPSRRPAESRMASLRAIDRSFLRRRFSTLVTSLAFARRDVVEGGLIFDLMIEELRTAKESYLAFRKDEEQEPRLRLVVNK